jgi:tetratricopeptide (TPR) repeat protein/tRNA A-37 threonylcarbamoyl transferase component Bud32/ribosomal protein S27AE
MSAMSVAHWSCPQCGDASFIASAADDRLGLCGGCGFALPREASQTDGSTWRRQAEMVAEAPDRGWPLVRPDRYRIIRALASGAQGRIYLAHHVPLDQVCVIKTLDVDAGWVELGVARLRAEARAAAMVAHPNVARFLDCDCVQDRWYFAMEYVPGANLRAFVLAVRRLCWEQVVAIGIAVAEGLDAIHAAGLIHRDIKPSNIMLRPDGTPKIMDLGLVKTSMVGPDPALTSLGQLIGTPYYMAPEQFDTDRDLTPQADTYGLGATLFHLLAGRPPHQGAGVVELGNKHKHDAVVWPEDATRTTPNWLRRVVETCLAKRPEHRFDSMRLLVDALRSAADVTRLLPSSVRRERARGVMVHVLENLSRRPEHDWIGDAVAEYLELRLRGVAGLHVVDRHSLARVGPADLPASASTAEQLVARAGKLGAGLVIVGNFQCSGGSIRLLVHAVGEDHREAARVSANAAGKLDDLFQLEDQLAEAVLRSIGQPAAQGSAREQAGGTADLAANEQFILGKRAFADGNYTSAVRHAESALKLDTEYAEPLSLIGAACARVGDYDRAVEFHQRAELAARRDDDSRRLAEALGNLGVMYYYKGEYPVAFDFLQQACELCGESGYQTDRAKYAGNLGFVLMRLNRSEDAEKAFAEAIEVHKQVGDLVSLAGPYNGMGGVLLKQARYAEAAEYYRRALGLAEEIGDRVNIGVSHMNLGRCACLLGDFAEAEACFGEALEALETTDFWNGRTLVYEHMADMYLQEGDHARALDCIAQRLALAEKHDNHRMQAEAWEQRAKAFEMAGDREKAFESLKRSLEISQKPALHESLHRHLSEIAKRQPFA